MTPHITIDVPDVGGVRLTYDEGTGWYETDTHPSLGVSVEIQLSHIVPRDRAPFWSCDVEIDVHRDDTVDEFTAAVHDPDRDTALRVALAPFVPLLTDAVKAGLRGES